MWQNRGDNMIRHHTVQHANNHQVLKTQFDCSELYLNIAISGLSLVCGKSRKGCDWTFHIAACPFIKGIIHWCCIFRLSIIVYNLFKHYCLLCSGGESLKNLVPGQIAPLENWAHFWALGETHMNLHLIHSFHRFSAVYLFQMATSKINALVIMPHLLLIWKGIPLLTLESLKRI